MLYLLYLEDPLLKIVYDPELDFPFLLCNLSCKGLNLNRNKNFFDIIIDLLVRALLKKNENLKIIILPLF